MSPNNRVTTSEVFSLAYPSMLGMAFVTLQNFIDTAFLSHLGILEVAAVGLTSWIIMTVLAFFKGLMASTNTFVARYYGGRRLRAIGIVTWHELYIAGFFGIIIFLIGQASPFIIKIIAPPDEIADHAATYLTIRFYDGFFIAALFVFQEFFRGISRPRITMIVTALTAFINCILTYTLIFGKYGLPAMGIKGAAIGTVLAELAGFLLFLSIFLSKNFRKRYHTTLIPHLRLSLVKRIFRIGLPISLHGILDSASFLAFAIIVAKLGTVALAVNQIVFQIFALSFMPGGGFGKAATTLVSKYIGAGDIKNARRSGYLSTGLALGIMMMISATFIFVPHWYIGIFSDDPLILELGAKVLFIAAICEIFDVLSMVFSGCLCGAGDTFFDMVAVLISAWGIFIPAAYFLGIIMEGGIVGAWWGMTLFFASHGILCMIRFISPGWETIKI